MSTDFPTLAFETQQEWEQWLDKNHADSEGVWIQFFKKDSGVKTIVYAEAVEEALCYGWIDSLAKRLDEKSYIQKFTPRKPKSIWSKINTVKVEKLIQSGKMKPAGLQRIEEAKQDGRWAAAYDAPSTSEIPKDLLAELEKNSKAKTFFESLNKTNLYAITWRLQTAKKPETRAKRMGVILEMLAKGEKFH